MKRISYVITLAAILCLFNVRGYAYAFSAKNAQGVTLYYNYINDGLELELTHGENKYPAKLIIPEEVTFMNRTRKVTKIGASTFWYGGQDLTSITLPQSITAIGDQAFNHCFFLTSIQLPSNLKSIGESAFNYCEQLKSITIPSSVTEIGSYAFYRCKALTSIVLPDGIKKIESHTFEGCSALKSITIPEGVTKIDYEAFKECEKLTSLTIPSSVTAIESGAFNGINIETITIYNRHPFYIREKKDIGTSQFNQNTYNNATLYVPTGSKEVYKSTRGWSDFLFIEEKDLVIPDPKPIVDNTSEKVDDEEIFQVVEEMPEFPGGQGLLLEFLSENIKYPEVARANGVQGRVIVEFAVEKDGTITDAKVFRSLDPACDKEAIRVILSMPKWKPGKTLGKPVRVKFTVPVQFRLQ